MNILIRFAFYIFVTIRSIYGDPAYSDCYSIEINSQNIKLPVGITESHLSEIGEIFSNHPEFSNMRAMVLYGSRLHHEAGYKPIDKSDLDVTFIAMTDISPLERVEISFKTQTIFQKIADRTGIKIAEEIPTLLSEAEILSSQNGSRFNSLTREAEEIIWRKTEDLAQINNWNRIQTKEHFLQGLKGGFTKDVLIILKGPGHNKFRNWLISRNYKNILVLE